MVVEMFLDEPGELRCSHLELPLLTSESLNEVVMLHVKYITDRQWVLIAGGKVDSATVMLLCDLCHYIVERVHNLVLDVVAPQVSGWTSGQSLEARTSDHSNASVTMNGIESPHQERNFHTVTEEDMQASLGDSLHLCLGEMLDVTAERSENSEQLMLLVAEEVAKKVNRQLAGVTEPTSSRQSEESSESPTTNMVYHVVKILERCLAQNVTYEVENSITPEEEGMEEDFTTGVTKACQTERQSSKQSTRVTSVTPFTCEEEFSQGEKTFLAVFLSKLLDHIAHSTKISLLDLDFDGAFKDLRRTLGGTGFPLPQTVGNLHSTIFIELCREFGSAKLLRAAAVSGGPAFGEAVARELEGQLLTASRKPLSFVGEVRRYFRRKSSKQAPACEVARLENGSTPRTQKRPKRPAIIGMFSAAARILRKPFTCSCRGSQDDQLTQESQDDQLTQESNLLKNNPSLSLNDDTGCFSRQTHTLSSHSPTGTSKLLPQICILSGIQ